MRSEGDGIMTVSLVERGDTGQVEGKVDTERREGALDKRVGNENRNWVT